MNNRALEIHPFKKAKRSFMLHSQLYLLLLLPLIYVAIFCYWPMYGLQIAFRDYRIIDGFVGSKWTGLKNFKAFLNDYNFERLLTNTLGISLYSIIAGFLPPIILAVALNECRKKLLSKTVQTITYLPYFLSTVVVTSIVLQLFQYEGLVNRIVKLLGGTPVPLMGEPQYFKSIYVWSGIWQGKGYSSIIYLAALSAINPELQEAAHVDGANIWQRIWHVDLPGIIPTATILLILKSASILNVGYEKVYLMQNPLNMPASDVVSTYVYRIGLVDMNYSYSTAVNLYQSIISVTLMVLVNKISSSVSENSLW